MLNQNTSEASCIKNNCNENNCQLCDVTGTCILCYPYYNLNSNKTCTMSCSRFFNCKYCSPEDTQCPQCIEGYASDLITGGECMMSDLQNCQF
jgi:hypothetical protein